MRGQLPLGTAHSGPIRERPQVAPQRCAVLQRPQLRRLGVRLTGDVLRGAQLGLFGGNRGPVLGLDSAQLGRESIRLGADLGSHRVRFQGGDLVQPLPDFAGADLVFL